MHTNFQEFPIQLNVKIFPFSESQKILATYRFVKLISVNNRNRIIIKQPVSRSVR